MPTRWTQTLIPTLRQPPSEAEVPSHQLMLRAGIIRKLTAGVYDYLPLGCRSLFKVMRIIREEMATAGAVEVFLPTLIPIELFQQTGRDAAYGDNLFRIKDRHGREEALGPTHEEVITELVAGYVESYKQLPLTLFQIQTKFRDEFRPRFGILRSREFQMKDAYSFHTALGGPGGLDEIYQKQYDAYCRIFSRCGLPYVTVEAESGPIGGSASHEFMIITPTGEDTILESDKGNYAANVEKCEIGPRNVSESFPLSARQGHLGIPAAPPKGELTKIHTPNCPGIEDVCEFFKKSLGSKLKTSNMLKSLVYVAIKAGDDPDPHRAKDPWYVLAIVRGDHEVNEGKLRDVIAALLGAKVTVSLAPIELAKADGFAVGFIGPRAFLGRDDCCLAIDPDAAIDQFWVTGAEEADHHVKGFHWKREVLDPLAQAGSESAKGRVIVADIRNAVEGDPSPRNDGGVLHVKKGIEVGHVFKLGDKYTRAMNVTVLMPDNSRVNPIMGCYGIGVNRILAAAIEKEGGRDENGIIWPAAIAPYQVLITAIKYASGSQANEVLDRLAAEIETSGCDVLIDDRDERPGVKFKDADLVGIPLRITIGEGAAEGKVEMKTRNGSNGPTGELVAIDQAAARAIELLKTL